MSTKAGQAKGGNAAERLRMTRPMPVFQMAAPLPAEGAPAVAVTTAPKAATPKAKHRGYRVSSYMTDEAGARLNRLVAHFKATYGRRHGAPDVLERALLALERELAL